MPGYKIFLGFIISFLAGIWLCQLYVDTLYVRFFVVLMIIFYGLVFFVKDVRIILFLFFAVILGFWRFSISNDDVKFPESLEQQLTGCIFEEVDIRNDKVKYIVTTESFGKILVNAARYPVFEYGDCLRIRGSLQQPGLIEDFDYGRYLARYDIYWVVYRAQVEKIGEAQPDVFQQFFKLIYVFKADFELRLRRIFAEPHASFMAGLLVGSRKGIPEELMTKFNITGLSHIVAISGYNIALVILVVSSLFNFLSRKWKVVLSIFFIVIFVILVGASAAVVRAAIMGGIGLIALFFGRQYMVLIGLFSAVFFMNIWNPKILVDDVGFQLSVLATAGVIWLSPVLMPYFQRLPRFFREALVMTLAAQIAVLPIILLNFERLSLISPIANIFVLPFIPLAMLLGFFAGVSSYLSFTLAKNFGFLGYLVLELEILLVKFFAEIPLASIEIGWFNWWLTLVWYGVLAYILRFKPS